MGGVRVYCGLPNSCAGQTPVQPVVPQALAPPPPALTPLSALAPGGSVSAWVGPKAGPGTGSGACPCGTYVTTWNVWNNATFAAAGEAGALAGITGVCSGPDAVVLNIMRGTGAPLLVDLAAGFQSIDGQSGTLINSVYGVGGTGPNPFSQICSNQDLILGMEVASEVSGTASYIAGLRVICGNPATANCASGPPALPTPAAPPVTPPPLDWTGWVGPKAGPAAYNGTCPCGTFVDKVSVWTDAGAAVTGFSAQCSSLAGAPPTILPFFPGAGAPENAASNVTGFAATSSIIGSVFAGAGTVDTTVAPFCEPGQLVLGIEVATEVRGTTQNLAGIRFLCGQPTVTNCASNAATPATTPAATLPAVTWTAWVGPKAGPVAYNGTCPCNTFVDAVRVWADASAAVTGLVGACSAPPGGARSLIQLLPGAGQPTSIPSNATGFVDTTPIIGSVYGAGSTSGLSTAPTCPPGEKVLALEIATELRGTTENVAGIRFRCGNPAVAACGRSLR